MGFPARTFGLEVCLAVEAHGGLEAGGGLGGVVCEGEAVGVRHRPEAGLPQVGPLAGDHRLQGGTVAVRLKAAAAWFYKCRLSS